MAKKRMTLQQAARALGEAQAVLSQHRDAEAHKRNARCVGKFYRYRNCYSCPQEPSDYWWLYHAISDIDEHGHLHGWSFQTDKDGKLMLETRRSFISPVSLQEEITEVDFYAAFDAVLAVLDRLRLAR